MSKKVESLLENLMFNSRWLLAPFYLALVGCILILLVGLVREIGEIIHHLMEGEGNIIIGVLNVVDTLGGPRSHNAVTRPGR